MRWLVPVLCVVAAATALVLGSSGTSGTSGTAPDLSAPSPPPADGPAVDPTEDVRPDDLAALQDTADEVAPMGDAEARALLSSCLEVDPDADPELSPDPDEVEVVATGSVAGTAALVWSGPSPQHGPSLGTCVAIRHGDDWRRAGRSVRPDPGAGTRGLTWQPAASDAGSAAVLSGRLDEDASVVLVVLEEGRVLRQQVERGIAVIAWQPVDEPQRIIVIGPDDEISYQGPLTSYAP